MYHFEVPGPDNGNYPLPEGPKIYPASGKEKKGERRADRRVGEGNDEHIGRTVHEPGNHTGHDGAKRHFAEKTPRVGGTVFRKAERETDI